ncbi:unnamed protein product, partial [Timema podura]|nr:unnamed protein product [Timema podura]
SIWGTNPHFLGCYSYRSVDSDVLGVSASQLAIPVVNSQGKEGISPSLTEESKTLTGLWQHGYRLIMVT